jgi:putative ABC transport system permease protein
LSYPNYVDVAARGEAFEASAAYDEWRTNLTGRGEPELIDAAVVNAGFFDVFGVRPAAGRFFRPEDDIDGQDRVVVLSWRLWQGRFDGDPGIVGGDIELNGTPHTVVGIAPREFEDPMLSGSSWGRPMLWRPLGYAGAPEDSQPNRGSSSYVAVARLRESVPVERMNAQLASLSTALEAEYPEQNADVGMVAEPIRDAIVGDSQDSLLIVLGAVTFVLLIAAANVGSLLLGRAAERRSEIAVRAALGASRWRIARQTVVESLVVAGAGGALGILVALAATRWLGTLVRQFVPRSDAVGLNLPVLGFTFGVTVAAGLLCAVLPALLAAGADPRTAMGESGRGSSGGTRSRRFRRSLVAAEVALAIVLLVGAGLLGRTLWNLMRVDVGIETAGLLAFDVAPPAASYPDMVSIGAFYDELLYRLSALPGVRAAGAVNIAPLSGGFDGNRAMRVDDPDEEPVSVQVRTVSPGYFRTAGVTVTSGRALGPADRAGAPVAAVVTDAFAELLWPGEDPIGRQFIVVDTVATVVGLAADVKHLRLDEPSQPMLFLALDQGAVAWHGRRMTVFVRVAGDPLGLASAVRSTVSAIDPRLPIRNLQPMDAVVAQAAAAPRFRALLLGLFAGLALVLAAIGIYGVVSFSVAQRTREMAIRMALGARSSGVMRLVMRDGLSPVIAGVLLGLLVAWALSRVLTAVLFGVGATDVVVFFAVPATLLAVAALSTLGPARRALRSDPMDILRES